MIKINLVPVKEKKKRKEFLIGFVVVALVVVLALGMFWIYVQRVRVKSNLKNEIAQIKEESKSYEDKINEVKDLQAKETSLEAFKKTIKSISETQRKILVGVDQLALGLNGGVWVTNISQGKGKDEDKFVLNGYSFTALDLNRYFNAIQRPGKFLKDATLDVKSFSASSGGNQQIHQFEVTARVLDLGS